MTSITDQIIAALAARGIGATVQHGWVVIPHPDGEITIGDYTGSPLTTEGAVGFLVEQDRTDGGDSYVYASDVDSGDYVNHSDLDEMIAAAVEAAWIMVDLDEVIETVLDVVGPYLADEPHGGWTEGTAGGTVVLICYLADGRRLVVSELTEPFSPDHDRKCRTRGILVGLYADEVAWQQGEEISLTPIPGTPGDLSHGLSTLAEVVGQIVEDLDPPTQSEAARIVEAAMALRETYTDALCRDDYYAARDAEDKLADLGSAAIDLLAAQIEKG